MKMSFILIAESYEKRKMQVMLNTQAGIVLKIVLMESLLGMLHLRCI